jgi:hypothetical protein
VVWQLVEVDPLAVVTVEQEAVGERVVGFQAGPGEDHHRSPVVDLGVFLQEQEDFGKQSPVDLTVSLKLHFDEVDRLIGGSLRWQEDPIDAKGSFLHLDGFKAVALALTGGADQVKEQGRGQLEEEIEEGIGFHASPG